MEGKERTFIEFLYNNKIAGALFGVAGCILAKSVGDGIVLLTEKHPQGVTACSFVSIILISVAYFVNR